MERIVVVGGSGAGKSTLVRAHLAVHRLRTPGEVRAFLDAVPAAGPDRSVS